MAKEVRSTNVELSRSSRLNLNAGVIAYRQAMLTAVLMHEIVRVLLNNIEKGDQYFWGMELENFAAFGNLRYSEMPPRFHLQRCAHDQSHCVIDGPVVLLHGRCWLMNRDPPIHRVCEYMNRDTESRLIHTDCSKIRVLSFEADKVITATSNSTVRLTQKKVST